MDLDLENYILGHIEPEDEVLEELSRETHLKTVNPRMLSGHLQGQILTFLVKMIQPATILEIGTFTGYSTICLSKGLKKGGKIYTIEIDDEILSLASRYFKIKGINDSVVQIIGNAIEKIPGIDDKFDLVFIDGDKREYCEYYSLVFDKVAAGGYIIADNTLWAGKVATSPPRGDKQLKGIQDFNETIKNDSRIEKVILPIRDGVTLIRKKQAEINFPKF